MSFHVTSLTFPRRLPQSATGNSRATEKAVAEARSRRGNRHRPVDRSWPSWSPERQLGASSPAGGSPSLRNGPGTGRGGERRARARLDRTSGRLTGAVRAETLCAESARFLLSTVVLLSIVWNIKISQPCPSRHQKALVAPSEMLATERSAGRSTSRPLRGGIWQQPTTGPEHRRGGGFRRKRVRPGSL
jgi:hypothetical protein